MLTYAILLITFTFNIFIFCFIGELLTGQVVDIAIIFILNFLLSFHFSRSTRTYAGYESREHVLHPRMVPLTRKNSAVFNFGNGDVESTGKTHGWEVFRSFSQ